MLQDSEVAARHLQKQHHHQQLSSMMLGTGGLSTTKAATIGLTSGQLSHRNGHNMPSLSASSSAGIFVMNGGGDHNHHLQSGVHRATTSMTNNPLSHHSNNYLNYHHGKSASTFIPAAGLPPNAHTAMTIGEIGSRLPSSAASNNNGINTLPVAGVMMAAGHA